MPGVQAIKRAFSVEWAALNCVSRRSRVGRALRLVGSKPRSSLTPKQA